MKGYDLITYMGNTLKSDVDHNKKIDVGDVDYILNNRTEK
jgi:hypothetical protein